MLANKRSAWCNHFSSISGINGRRRGGRAQPQQRNAAVLDAMLLGKGPAVPPPSSPVPTSSLRLPSRISSSGITDDTPIVSEGDRAVETVETAPVDAVATASACCVGQVVGLLLLQRACGLGCCQQHQSQQHHELSATTSHSRQRTYCCNQRERKARLRRMSALSCVTVRGGVCHTLEAREARI